MTLDGLVELLLVRHGESEGNLAAARAHEEGAERIEVPARDADVALSPLGQEQARALGTALTGLAAAPDLVVCSPYLRARQTADAACRTAGLVAPVRVDERLRDRELGVLDRLTQRGVRALHPDEAERREWLGKFYHRPSGGESWADVALRLRTWLTDADRYAAGQRVVVFSHDVVVLLLRYACLGLDEGQVLDIARRTPLRNASLSRLVRTDEGSWELDRYDDVAHLEAAGMSVTRHEGERP